MNKTTTPKLDASCKFCHLFFLIIIISCLTACDDQAVYEENYDFDQKAWPVDTVPAFQFEISDPGQEYNIFWNIRNSINYPYRNLYLTYYLEDTLGQRISTDLHNMLLFDTKTGKPYGSGLGDIFSHQILAMPSYKFDTAGVYNIRLEQYMRTDTLKEIFSVGVRIEQAQ